MKLIEYVIAYLQEEVSGYNVTTYGSAELRLMVDDAIDAYEGGAR